MGFAGESWTGEDFLGEIGGKVISPSPIEMALEVPGPTVTGSGTVSVGVDAPIEMALSVNDVAARYTIAPTPIEMAIELPGPEVTGSGTVTVGVDAPIEMAVAVPADQAIGYPFWAIDDTPIDEHVSEIRDWQTLGLVFRVDSTTLSNELTPLKDTAEKHEVVPASDGSFSTLDRASTDGIYTLTPPVGRDPPREERDYLVESYRQRQLDQAGTSHEVDLSFVAKSNRDPDGTATDELRASDEWAFDFRSAQVATTRVTPDVGEGTNTAAETVDLTLLLDATQTKVLEESLTRLAAVSTREVPDGTNTVDDDSDAPAGANTFTVTTPDGESPIPDGNYVAMDWSTDWQSDRLFRVDLTMGKP